MSYPLLEMTKARLREFRREPSAFYFVLLMPILWMTILGIGLSHKKTVFRVGVDASFNHPRAIFVDEDKRILSKHAVLEELLQDLKKGKLALIIKNNSSGGVELIFDESKKDAEFAAFYVKDIIKVQNEESTISFTELNLPGSRYIDFLVPGLLALSLFTTSLFGTGMTIVVNRRENLLKRYMVTPMRPSHYIASHIIGRYTIAFLEISVILTFAYFVFHFYFVGNFFQALLLCLLGTSTFSAFGILLGSRTANAGVYNGFVNLMTIPMMMLSGVWFSRSYFPEWLMKLTDFLPLTALVESLRQVAYENVAWYELFSPIFILLSYLFVSVVFAKKLFKWY